MTTNFVDGLGTAPSNIDPGASVTHDDDTSYRQATQPSRGDIWYCATGKPVVEVVYASTANIRFRGVGYTPGYSVGFFSAEALIGSYAAQSATGSYANLARSGTPTPSQVNASTFGIGWATTTDNPVSSRLTSAWIVLSYDPPGACFMPLWSLIAGVLGSGIGLEHMPGIARFLRTLGHGVPPEEFERALRSLKSWRRPRYSRLWLPATV